MIQAIVMVPVQSFTSLPEAIKYMVKPPKNKINGRKLADTLYHCAKNHAWCQNCELPRYCEFYYRYLVDSDQVKSWKGTNRNVARYFK